MDNLRTVYKKPESLTDTTFSYCPGCGHGTVHRIIAELMDEFKLREKAIAVAPVGCAVFAYDFFNFDTTEAAHGRAPAVAAAIKRLNPDKFVLVYQGDGDLASIGMAETVHTANRGENVTVIFINNVNYGMTGGQMAPTTLIDQVTTTSPAGRKAAEQGFPIKIPELLASLPGAKFLARVKVSDAGSVIRAKKVIKKAFENQINGKGFSLVEVLCACPANWKMEPADAVKYVDTAMAQYFVPGIIKDEN